MWLTLAFGFMLLPVAFFWCNCCNTCRDCEARKKSILVTFGGDWVTPAAPSCGCFDPVSFPCEDYQGTTYEVPLYEYTPFHGGSNSSGCEYRLAVNCEYHHIEVVVGTSYSNGIYYSTLIRAGIRLNTPSGACSSLIGDIEILASEESEFDCDAARVIDLPDPSGFPRIACATTSGTVTVESP